MWIFFLSANRSRDGYWSTVVTLTTNERAANIHISNARFIEYSQSDRFICKLTRIVFHFSNRFQCECLRTGGKRPLSVSSQSPTSFVCRKRQFIFRFRVWLQYTWAIEHISEHQLNVTKAKNGEKKSATNVCSNGVYLTIRTLAHTRGVNEKKKRRPTHTARQSKRERATKLR